MMAIHRAIRTLLALFWRPSLNNSAAVKFISPPVAIVLDSLEIGLSPQVRKVGQRFQQIITTSPWHTSSCDDVW